MGMYKCSETARKNPVSEVYFENQSCDKIHQNTHCRVPEHLYNLGVCPAHHGHGGTQQIAAWSWRENMDLKQHCMVMFDRTPGWLMVTDMFSNHYLSQSFCPPVHLLIPKEPLWWHFSHSRSQEQPWSALVILLP